MKMHKRMVVLLLLSIMLFCGCDKDDTRITGDEWLLMQSNYMYDLELLIESIDDVYTLYFIDSLSEADFEKEVEILQAQYDVLQETYRRDKEANPIGVGNYSAVAQEGVQGIEAFRETLGKVIAAAHRDGELIDADELVYTYLALQSEMTDCLIQYVKAYNLIINQEREAR